MYEFDEIIWVNIELFNGSIEIFWSFTVIQFRDFAKIRFVYCAMFNFLTEMNEKMRFLIKMRFSTKMRFSPPLLYL